MVLWLDRCNISTLMTFRWVGLQVPEFSVNVTNFIFNLRETKGDCLFLNLLVSLSFLKNKDKLFFIYSR